MEVKSCYIITFIIRIFQSIIGIFQEILIEAIIKNCLQELK